ncbi:unnamed protein product [Arctogadus glacialis]
MQVCFLDEIHCTNGVLNSSLLFWSGRSRLARPPDSLYVLLQHFFEARLKIFNAVCSAERFIVCGHMSK